MWATGERTLLLAAVAFCCLATTAAASFPGHNGSIAFRSSSEAAGAGIFTVRPDGSAFASLNSDAFDPAWSPDGARIAFISSPDGPTSVIAMNEDGSGMVAVHEDVSEPRDPSWAPNGTRLAWTDLVPDGSVAAPAILTKNVGDQGVPDRLLTLPAGSTISGVAWSPDGSRIAFLRTFVVCSEVSCGPPMIELDVIPATGSALPTPLRTAENTESLDDRGDVAWSPDGSRIAVSLGPGDVRVVSAADGAELATIVPGAAFETSDGPVAWSPDGSRLVLAAELAGSAASQLVTVSPAGEDARAVSDEPVLSGAIDWQPLQAPVTTITAGPPAETTDPTARFQFMANKPSTFECRLDTRPWARCASGVQYTGLTVGSHTFAVRATDRHGVVEERAKHRTWRRLQSIVSRDGLLAFPKGTGIRARWYRYVYPRHMVQLRALRAVKVPSGVTIDVRCVGPGCPASFHRQWRTRRFRKAKPVLKGLSQSRLRPRAAVFVTLTKPGYLGIGKMYCVRYSRTVRVRAFTVAQRLPRCGPALPELPFQAVGFRKS